MSLSDQVARQSTDHRPAVADSRWIPTRANAVRIALWYAAVGALWILCSGWVLQQLALDQETEGWLERLKGWFFVSITALLLGLMLDRHFGRIRRFARELQANEARLQLVGDNLPGSYVFQYTRDANGTPRFTYISAGAERVHGVKLADILADAGCLLAQFDSDQSAALAEAEAESARNLTDFAMELPICRPDGSVRILHFRSKPRRNAEGLVHWEGFATDITRQKRAVEALQRSAQNYREIFNATNDAIFLHDASTGRVLDVNDAMVRLFGFDSKAEALAGEGTQVLNNDPPYDWPEARRLIQRAIQDGPQLFEWLARKKNGERFWVEVSLRSSEVGGQGRVLAVVRDVNLRKAQEAALNASEALLRMMGRTAKVGGWELDPATGEGKWTDEIAHLHDLDPAIKPSRAVGLSHFHGPHRQKIEAALAAATAHGTPYDLELELVSAKGVVKWVRTICQPEVKDGRVTRLCGSMQDITGRKNAEREIQRQAGLIQCLLDSIPDLIFFKDLDGVYRGCNPAFAEFNRRKREEIIGRNDYELYARDMADFFREQDERTLKSLQPLQNEEWVDYPDGRRVLLATLKTPYLGPDGSLLGVLGISRDLTARKEAEDKLRASEQRFRSLVEVAPDAIFVRTGEHFAYVNQAALKLFGAAVPADLLGQPVLERFQADCRQEVFARMKRLDETGNGTREADRVLLKLDGTEVEVSISAVPIEFAGKPSALVFARDISDRRRAETALWQQFELQNQLAKVAATVPGVIYSFMVRPDGSMSIPYASGAFECVFGIKPEAVREDVAPVFALISEADLPRVKASISASARTLKPWREEFRARSARGDIWVEGHSVPQLEPDGSILWHGFLHDITERKLAEKQVRKLSRAVEQSPVSIVITDANGDIEYVNPKFTELTGYTPEEVRGRNPRILKSSNSTTDLYGELWQTLRRGETWRGEFHNRKRNGEMFWEFASISPITDDTGSITHFLAVKEDITERKQLEAQLRQSQKLEAIGQLAGGVAHDFNNILAAMMIQAELSALARGIPDEVREGLQQIRAATERAANLTRQLLLFSRKQVLQPRNLDLNEAVTSLAKMLQRIIREDVRLQLHLHPAPLMTHADAGMLDQVLMNLAVNARDAMPDGGHLLIETSERNLDAAAARIHPDAAPGRYVCLGVTDNGCGMTPEVMARIFEPFFTTKEPGQGTGLGLATVFGIVKQHRGWLTVHSEPGKGTRFEVHLPAAEGQATSKPAAARPVMRGGTETILLVEDDIAVRRMTKILLERQGYTVIAAASGNEALQLWKPQRDKVALLLTDLVMPGSLTGQQLANELLAEKPGLRIVFTSGYSAEIAGGEINLRKGENFVQKPCSPAILLETIRRTLDD